MNQQIRMAYLVYNERIIESPTGVDKKILSQIKVFKDNGFECDIIPIKRKHGFLFTILSRLPFSNVYPIWKYDSHFDGYDCIYLRRPDVLTIGCINFLKHIKKNNPKTKVIYEIPTFPYDTEMKLRKRDYPFFFKDLSNRKHLKEVVDRLAIIEPDCTAIWGVKTLMINNGIDLSRVRIRNPQRHNGINLLAVAYYMPYHGLERVIEGLSNYYLESPTATVNLFIIGKGEEIGLYQNLSSSLNLTNHVFFEGEKKDSELDYYYDNCDFGLCSMAGYKKRMFSSKELKSREYAAKGIPILSGVHLDLFDNGFPYYLEFSNDNTALNINRIVKYYSLLEEEGFDIVSKRIRTYAETYLSMGKAIEKVVEYIKL